MNVSYSRLIIALLSICLTGISQIGHADPLVRMRTVSGDIFINLTPENAPNTVDNFLFYTNNNEYDNSFIHRSAKTQFVLGGPFEDFVIQGGGFQWFNGNSQPNAIPTTAPVANEFNVSNLRGTVAMAKPANQPDGATSQWFINLDDRNAVLDTNTGGFTVFGTVDDAGMQVADDIAALSRVNAGGSFGELPLLSASGNAVRSNVVLVESATTFERIGAPASAILPSSRSVGVGNTATGFATIVNSANNEAASCSMTPSTTVAASFSYRQTNPATNEAFGPNNPPLDIPAGGSASLVFSFTPNAAITSTAISFAFTCGNSSAGATLTPGVNTFELAASATAPADVVALAGTASGDGINNIPNSVGSGAFVVATVNLGAEETITVTADTGSRSLPLGLFVCATDAATGLCIDPATASTSTTMSTNQTGTFAVFAQLINATDTVSFDPAGNRAFVRFRNASGELRGSTSVALRTVMD